ncbi:MAG: hypothetical protein IKT50_05535 [Clostridia bacterium]|nr:hypothetical protein [Clostridia bacterium]
MKNKRILFILPAVITVLEALPYGAVCNFATPEESEAIRKTYSYFDLTPYGYANFGPFLTALCTLVLLVLGILFLVREGRSVLAAIRFVSLLGTLFSLMPLTLGLHYYSVLAGMISLCFATLSVVAIKTKI